MQAFKMLKYFFFHKHLQINLINIKKINKSTNPPYILVEHIQKEALTIVRKSKTIEIDEDLYWGRG
ncbi:hypothetical protein AsAng_0011540 [Aureispira anguillae]|uniref:Uncharacterized protein n=1 Tax=Aureispira anguillae TaxID=2864201 RepID=A0A916DQ04_9BACT|nr:hypothetical protein AsAng_0011540 [Aureispira anguillae]